LDAAAMRRLGYRTVDMLVDRLADPASQPPLRVASPAEMRSRLSGGPPAAGREFDDVVAELEEHVLPFVAHWGHPGYFAFIPGSSTFPGALGDFIAAACNVDAGAWTWGSGPSHVELLILDWFKEWIGYPAGAAGVLLSGGSAANMTALACAREALAGAMSDDLVAYCSDQAHSSVARAARILGFRPDQVRVLPSDDCFRMRPDALAATMAADVAARRRPLFVAAAAGSTNTGAVDPIGELAEIASQQGAWLHVDAAYGGFAALTERGAKALVGIERADSVTLDPHKWLYQPFECGCLLVRDGPLLDEAFVITPDYLRDVEAHGEVNFSDRGFQLTRVSRALKLWVSLQFFGVDAFREAIDRTLDLALVAQARVQESAELELLLPSSLGVTCFRRRFAGIDDEDALAGLNAQLVAGLAKTGKGLISSTRLRGRYALRLCVLNHTSRRSDVEDVLRWLEDADVDPAVPVDAARTAPRDRHPDTTSVRLERGRIAAPTLRALSLFASLTDAQLRAVARSARLASAAPGEVIVQKWEAARDFYVLVEGTAEVSSNSDHIRDLGRGDFFGELAALDWGASFGYPRLATVIATSPVQAVVLSSHALNTLMREAPGVAAQIERAVRERLTGP
jgi:glutamate/tyrosine decarboxylase-like PLP-dependent enzyme